MSRAIDDRADQFDYQRPPDTARREAGHDLRGRLTELSPAHPSSAGYPSIERADSRATPEVVSPDDIAVPADRRVHILDGEPGDGGGHRAGTGKPGKTEFPAERTDDRIIDAVLTVARNPEQPPRRQEFNERWQVTGTRDDVGIVAIVRPDGSIWTAWPREGCPGVVKNEKQRPSDGRI
jgi:Bacterial EndoU nuclease